MYLASVNSARQCRPLKVVKGFQIGCCGVWTRGLALFSPRKTVLARPVVGPMEDEVRAGVRLISMVGLSMPFFVR